MHDKNPMHISLNDFVEPTAPICYGILKPGAHHEGGIPVIKVKNIRNGTVAIDGLLCTSHEIDGQYLRSKVKPGDILLTIRGTTGDVAIVPEELSGANITQDTARIRIRSGQNAQFLFQAIQSSFVQGQIKLNTIGQAVKGINIAEVRKLQIFCPSRNEQNKIVEILGAWDKAIETAEKLAKNSKSQKTALIQKLLTGKTRLKKFKRSSWHSIKANQIFNTVSVRRNQGEELLAVTQDKGVIPRSLLERKVVMPEGDTDNYKLVEPGDFVISLRSFQGGLEYSSYRGMVSPAYNVLRPKIPIVDAFFRHYFKSYEFIGHLAIAVIGIRDGKQISLSDFSFLKLPYPDLEEQKQIADILDAAERESLLYEKQLELLRAEKKALMQQLLTGKRRVKVEA